MPVQIGFLGAGSAARRHAQSLAGQDAEIVAVCDIAAPRAEDFAAQFGGAVYSSSGRMLAGENLDALYICTPPHARGPVEIAAAKAGISLFIEPPVALNPRTAQSVLSALGKSGVLCSVGCPWRYLESTTRLKKLLAPKNAPQPQLYTGRWLENPPATAWRLDPKFSVGLWLDGAYPLLDLARYLGGEIDRVSAFATPDVRAATLQFQSGALASFGAASVLEKGAEQEISLTTSEAIHFLRAATLETRRGEETILLQGHDDAIALQNAAFLRAVTTGKRTEIRATYADAVKTLKLGLALNRAAQGSKAIKL